MTACGPEKTSGAGAGDSKAGSESSASPGSSEASEHGSGKEQATPEAGGSSGPSSSESSGAQPGEGGAGESKSPAGKGGDSTTWGLVRYVAPDKYTVTDDGTDKDVAFSVSKRTGVTSKGEICGDARTDKSETCTTSDLEKAAKRAGGGGLGAKVVITGGVATSVEGLD